MPTQTRRLAAILFAEMDYEFIPLQGYPPFEEFVKPKG